MARTTGGRISTTKSATAVPVAKASPTTDAATNGGAVASHRCHAHGDSPMGPIRGGSLSGSGSPTTVGSSESHDGSRRGVRVGRVA